MNFFLLIVLLILFDQGSKFLVTRWLLPLSQIKIFSFFYLTYQENTGAAFSIFSGRNSLLIFFSLVALSILFYWVRKEKRYNWPMALIFGGSVSNLFDRIFRGKVIDFLDFRIWPVFNFADAVITLGMLFLFLSALKKKKVSLINLSTY